MIKILGSVTRHSRTYTLRKGPSSGTNSRDLPVCSSAARLRHANLQSSHRQSCSSTPHCCGSCWTRTRYYTGLQNATFPQIPYSQRCEPSSRYGMGRKHSCSTAQVFPLAAAGGSRQVSVKRIGGSGDCLFAAIAQGHQYLTHGSFMRTPEERTAAAHLRQAVCAELVRQKDMMEPFIGEVEPYARSMAQQGVWGGEPELAMASRCLKCRIHVFQPDVAGLQAIAKYGEDFHPDTKPITLLYNGANHYDLMLIDG